MNLSLKARSAYLLAAIIFVCGLFMTTSAYAVSSSSIETRGYIGTDLASYSTSYDANGGVGGAVINAGEGSYITVLGQEEAGVTREGYTFVGWNTQADGRGTAYAPGDSYHVSGDSTLYAQWELIDERGTPGPGEGDGGGSGQPGEGPDSRMTQTSSAGNGGGFSAAKGTSFAKTGDTAASILIAAITLVVLSLVGLFVSKRRSSDKPE